MALFGGVDFRHPLMATKNFAIATLLNLYDAAAVSIDVLAGQAARFGDPPFMAVWWNSTDYGRPSNDPYVEVVKVTAIAGDTLTIVRGQEGTLASAKNAFGKAYRIYEPLTAGMWDGLVRIHPFDTLAAMTAAAAEKLVDTHLFLMRGLAVKYDGGYRLYIYDAGSTAAADDYSVVQPTNGAGRLHLLFG